MNPENELDNLAIKYGSDKFGSHWYTKEYHAYFKGIRTDPVELLEIGIGGYDDPAAGGASLKMWREYFPLGTIYGLDWYKKDKLDGNRIKTYQGSQGDPRVLTAIINDSKNGQFDIIIDDGSHRNEHTIATFLMMFQYVRDGGWYVVEDTQTSYWADYGGSSSDLDTGTTTNSFFKKLIDGVNWQEVHRPGYVPSYLDLNVVALHFHHNMVFVKKGRNDAVSNFVVNNRVPTMM